MFQDSVPDGSYNDPFLSSVCECLYPQNTRIHLVTHQVSYRPDSQHNHGDGAFYGDFTSKNVIIMEYINSFISLLQWAFILKRGTAKLAVFYGENEPYHRYPTKCQLIVAVQSLCFSCLTPSLTMVDPHG